MANTVIALKKSATPTATPTNLANGELAINYADGILYYKAANGAIASIQSLEGNSFGTVNANGTLIVSDTVGDILTIEAGTNITITGDAVNDKITISASIPAGENPKYAFDHANAAFNTANIAFAHANAAFDTANTSGVEAEYAFLRANLAHAHANSAFANANTVMISTQAAFTVANSSFLHANAAYAFANSIAITANLAFAHANAAFANGNTVIQTAQSAFTQANASYLHANAAHASANAGMFIANGAFASANAGQATANAAFNTANTANITADRAWNHANAAFITANIAFANANTVMISAQAAFTVANSGFLHANSGYAFANSIAITANLAFAHANSAYANGNVVIQTAQSAFTLANNSYLHANAAFASANAGQASANAGQATANAAFNRANTANITADRAWNHANAAFITANIAFANANTVMVSAQAAFTVANSGFLHANAGYAFANSIAITANLAFVHANAAFDVANTSGIEAEYAFFRANLAHAHANSAFANANTVMISAQSAFTVANSGFLHANSGYAFANSIAITANLAFAHANAAFANGNTVIQTAQSAFTQANSAYLHANGAHSSANAGMAIANGAFASANAGQATANAAFTRANNSLLSSAYTAADVLSKLLTVDGTGSGLDADLLDGLSSASFMRKDIDQTFSGVLTLPQNPVGNTYGNAVSFTPTYMITQTVGDNDGWRLYGESSATNTVRMVFEVNDDIETGGYEWLFRNKKTYSDYIATEPFRISGAGAAYVNGNLVWHAGNDGAGSTLDADLLDGQQGTYYGIASDVTAAFLRANNSLLSSSYTAADVLAKLITVDGAGTTLDADLLDGQQGAYYGIAADVTAAFLRANNSLLSSSYTAADVLAKLITVDGAGTNLDADLLDGQQGTYYGIATDVTAANRVSNAAFLHANSGYAFANSIAITSNLAFAHANAAFLSSNAVNTYSDATYVKLTSSSQTITGNLNVVGTLTISGNTIFLDATRLEIDDPLIYLAGNNYTSDIVDIGFIANYVNATGQNVHTGLYREHENKEYYLFQGYDKEPINNHIGALSNNMTLAVLNADIKTSNLILGGANAILTIGASFNHANAAFASANAGQATANAAFNRANNSLLSSSYTAADVLSKLLTVDGAGTNLDADLLDGQQGAYYGIAADVTAAFLRANNSLLSSSYTAADVLSKLLTVDGAGTTLDADLLDGQQGAYYAIAADDLASHRVANAAFLHANAAFATANMAFANANTVMISAQSSFTLANNAYLHANAAFASANAGQATANAAFTRANNSLLSSAYTAADVLAKLITVDGAGTTLDADLLDGQQGTYYGIAADVTAAFLRANNSLLSSAYTAADVLAKLITVDGAGTTLDADLLDGQQGAYYGISTDVSAANRVANAAFLHANAAFATANVAFANANTVMISAQAAFTVANSSFLHANAAFIHANSAFATANGRVSSVSGTGTVSGLTLSGTVTTTGSLTLGGTLSASVIDNMTDEHRLFNNMGDTHSSRTAFDLTGPSINFGWRFVQGSANGPGVTGTQFYSEYVGLGNEYSATGAGSYGMQIAYPRNVTEPYITIRYNEANTFTAWTKVSAGNSDKLNSQAASYYGIATDVTAANRVANAAFLHANSAFATVNSAFATINVAFANANTVMISAQAAFTVANNAYLHANAAFATANTGQTTAVAAFARANNSLLSSAYTAADVLAKLLTVDGAGTTLDADLLDGQQGAYYGIAADVTAAFLRANNSLLSSSYTAADVLAKLITVDGAGTTLDADLLDGQQGTYYGIAADVTAAFLRANNSLLSSSYTAADVLSKLITVDGAGTNLDADLLDGQQGAYYGIATDVTAANRVANAAFLHANAAFNSANIALSYRGSITETTIGDNTSNAIRTTGVYTVSYTGASDGLIDIGGIGGSSPRIQMRFNYADELYFRVARDSEVNFDTAGPYSNRVWHSSNDGAGSGLDADLLDGQQGTYYGIAADVTAAFLRANNSLLSSAYTAADVLAKLITVDGAGTSLDADLLDGQQGTYYGIAADVTAAFLRANNSLLSSSYTAADVLSKLLTVDGAGTTLDADLLDGQQGTYYGIAADVTAAFLRANNSLLSSSYTAADVLSKLITVDGAGTSLDADLLDGQQGTYYGIATDVSAANRVANAAFLHANAAFAFSNSAHAIANLAFVHANAAFAKANSTVIVISPDAINATRYITFEDSTTGNMANANVSTSLTYNPGTNRLAVGGTGTPSNTLHVFGTANVSGTLKTAGLYDSTNRLLLIKNSSGTVVWGN